MTEHRLVDLRPAATAGRLVAELVPPPRFADVRFATYMPDPGEPTQAAAVSALEAFSARMSADQGRGRRWFRRGPAPPEGRAGVYLDGGFGVGKTHLLSSLWHAATTPPEAKVFCTFVELTNLVGALGFATAVASLSEARLLCLDEFELDDPGDTVLISTLLSRLTEVGVYVAATSNTLPDKLGEGRFAAQDFLREIQVLAAQFDVLRIEGDDYRHRGLPAAPPPANEAELRDVPPGGTLDEFGALCAHLATIHPSRYGPLLDGVSRVHLRDVETIHDQSMALRLVVFADRLYDREISMRASGVPLDQVFAPDMLTGGYRKKYFRAISRLVALARPSE